MHIKKYKPQVTIRTTFGVALRFIGTLCCPVCPHEFEIRTGGHILWPEVSSIPDTVKYEIEDFTKQRACPKCGVVSAVPAKELSELEHEAAELVTLSWVEKQIEMSKQPARETA
ncbi:MAG: hypothetical protein ACYC6X_00345 [Minisyncoccota bacterium]